MNFNMKRIKPKRKYLIFFGLSHYIMWLISCFLFGWWGILLGFVVNCVMDMGVLLIWMWQENTRYF